MVKVKSDKSGKIKRSTDDLINDAIAQQNDWHKNRRAFARDFLGRMNVFARPKDTTKPADRNATKTTENNQRGLLAEYWFPILCAFIVIFIAIWVCFVRANSAPHIFISPAVPEPVVKPVRNADAVQVPSFDIVRIHPDGNIVVAGLWRPDSNVSIAINGKIVATERTNATGDFVYAPTGALEPGNHTISLIGADGNAKSADKVFVYISPRGYENSVSLLMTKDGSTVLQAPTKLYDGDLTVSKIDYLSSGRMVVTGDSLPRLRVSLTLDGKYMGFARVSDHRHFGLGADVGELKSGREYELQVRLHDGDGTTISSVTHRFTMPEMTGDDDTFYTVRRGDCLWIIARNFMRRGILFSIIAERNNIKNPDLIFPKQTLQIPVQGK